MTEIQRIISFPILLLIFGVPKLLRSTNAHCPAQCYCNIQHSIFLATQLQTTNCSNLNLSKVPDDIDIGTEALLLSRNNLTDLFSQLREMPALQELDLSHNRIKKLGRGVIFGNLTALRALDLSYNDFRTVFDGVFKNNSKLEVLLMTNVQIKFIEEHVFDGLENLKQLHISNNQLHAIFPEWFADMPLLESLYLDWNYISYINSGSFAFLKQLRYLSLTNNKIRGISDSAFVGMENLTNLYLNNNQLTKVPSSSLQPITDLQVLKLGGNLFFQIHTGDFSHAPLKEIYLENLSHLTLVDSGAFKDLPHLHMVHLHNNSRLQYIDSQAFIGVSNLHVLSLHNNNLSALSKDLIDSLPGALKLSLYGNPLLCDCNIKWIHEVIATANQSRIILLEEDRMQCARPSELKDRHVNNLDKSEVPHNCPPFLVGTVNGTVNKKFGDRHVFQCRSHGIPSPKIHWILPNGMILNESITNVHLQLKPSSLEIMYLTPKDAGLYICIAENYMGEAISTTELLVENIDIHIFPLGIASTFVTVVWNGTARNTFPEYEILYHQDNQEENGQPNSQSVTVSQFSRSYTINHLQPHSTYKFCIGVKNKEDDQYVQFSCTRVQTRDESFMLQGIHHTSNVAIAVVLAIVSSMVLVVCIVTVAARKYRQRQYDTPEKALVTNMAQIPMENLHSPLMANVGP